MNSEEEIFETIDVQDGDSHEENEVANEVTEPVAGTSTEVKPKKRKTRSKAPKLNAERLKGPQGLRYLEKICLGLKFKGKGHEKRDLNYLMYALQFWCHKIFPKYTFDDCINQLEKLGSKKEVITLKKKILYNMFEEDQPLNLNDAVADDNDDDDDDNNVMDPQERNKDVFDMLLEQDPLVQQPLPKTVFSTQPATNSPEVVELTEEQKQIIERNRQIAAERRQARLEALKQKKNAEITTDTKISSQDSESFSNSQTLILTEEQRSMIEKNRLLALEKRKKLQKQQIEMSLENCDTSESISQKQNVSESVIDCETNVVSSQENNLEINITKECETIEHISQKHNVPELVVDYESNVSRSQENNMEKCGTDTVNSQENKMEIIIDKEISQKQNVVESVIECETIAARSGETNMEVE